MTRHHPKHPERKPRLVWWSGGVAITEVEVKPDRDFRFYAFLMTILLLVGAALFYRDVRRHPRPQADVIASHDDAKLPLGLQVPHQVAVPTILPPTITIAPEPPADAPMAPNATTVTADLPRTDELRGSVDLPNDSKSASNAEEITSQASAIKGLPDDSGAGEITPTQPAIDARHADRHARRRLRHLHGWRAYHRANPVWCDPVCGFFKAAAHLAGLI